MLGKSHVAVQLNLQLNDCTALIHTRYRELSEKGEVINASQLIQPYLREQIAREDIAYSELSYSFIEGLDFYLKRERRLSLATIQIVVIFLRKLIDIGQQRQYIRVDPFADFKPELSQHTRRYLTTEELQCILETPIKDKQFE